IFFKYDIEPISVRITEKYTSFSQFLVRLCGIVGGIWVTAGFVFRIADGICRSVVINSDKNKNDFIGTGGGIDKYS
ncbi:8758_t:CDS:1, partial [Ambispora gerdemannii]